MLEVGQRWGKLTLLERIPGRTEPHPQTGKPRKIGVSWRCLCDCGKEATARGDNIDAGRTRSCGCERKRFNNNVFFKVK